MNLFVLDLEPRIAAQFHCDKHVVKMILETAQLLSTAHHVLSPVDLLPPSLYLKTHVNHPCAVWVRQTSDNYIWAHQLGMALCEEYTHRYGKTHKTKEMLQHSLNRLPVGIPMAPRTEFCLCMPDKYKDAPNAVVAYRDYYRNEKHGFANYTKRDAPAFMI